MLRTKDMIMEALVKKFPRMVNLVVSMEVDRLNVAFTSAITGVVW